MVGLDNAGKTTVVKRVSGESIDEISPTLGFNIKTMTYGDYSLNVWDVGGQKTLRAYWRNYYEATDGLIWVVDSADSRRMRDCAEALASVLEEEKLAGAMLVFANKRDIRGAMDVDAIADALGLKRLVNRHWHIVGCSAVTGEGLLDGFDWLVNDCAERGPRSARVDVDVDGRERARVDARVICKTDTVDIVAVTLGRRPSIRAFTLRLVI